MNKIFRQCIFCIIITTITATFFLGLYLGFQVGKGAVCGDVAFYYSNDLPIKDCVNYIGSGINLNTNKGAK